MHSLRFWSFVVALVPLLAACGDDDPAGDQGPRDPEPITIKFLMQVNSDEFVCGMTYRGVGSPRAEFRATDARFYVYDVALIDTKGTAHPVELEDDGAFQGNGVALLDFEDGCGPDGTPEMNTELRGKVVPGPYQSLRFTLGVPPELNSLDLATAAPPLDVTGMYWTWLSGYKFLKMDASTPMDGGGIYPYLMHIGSAGCPGDRDEAPPTGPCAFPNRITYELPGYTGSDKSVTADVADLLADIDLSYNTDGTPPGCMSMPDDPECQLLLPRLGVDDVSQQLLFKVW